MISTSNYVARKYGVRSAMPGFIAKRLCPELVFVDCHYEKYKAASQQVQEVILEYNSRYVHDFGLDEFYVDITECVHFRWGRQVATGDLIELRRCAESVVLEIRNRISERTGGLTSSAGIAHNFFLAKIGADKNKPNGQFSLPPNREETIEFVHALPCRKVGGIGKVSEKILNDLGMTTMGDVMQRLPLLYHVLSSKFCTFLAGTCLGIGTEEGEKQTRFVGNSENDDSRDAQKRMSCERTFTATADKSFIYCKLYDICMSIAPKIKAKGLRPLTLTLKLKTSAFDVLNRSTSIDSTTRAFDNGEYMFNCAKTMLDSMLPLRVRLIGVSVSKFIYRQLNESASIISYFMSKEKMLPCIPLPLCDFQNDVTGSSECANSYQSFDSHLMSDGTSSSFENTMTNYLCCPVCATSMQLNLFDFNIHVDECLTRVALGDDITATHSQTDQFCSSSPKHRKSNSILLYASSSSGFRSSDHDILK